MKQALRAAVSGALIACGTLGAAGAADQDLNSWNVLQYNHRWTDHWGTQIQAELRIHEDLKDFDEYIVKPSIVYFFSENLKLALGYKYIIRGPDDVDEQDPWQEVTYSHKLEPFALKHQVRIEERLRKDISGVLPRIRYILGATYPLDDRFHLAASNETRFNLRDAGVGPVGGFEQNRLFGGVGYKIDEFAAIELGYMWRYERRRSKPDKSDHVLHFQFVLSTDQRKK